MAYTVRDHPLVRVENCHDFNSEVSERSNIFQEKLAKDKSNRLYYYVEMRPFNFLYLGCVFNNLNCWIFKHVQEPICNHFILRFYSSEVQYWTWIPSGRAEYLKSIFWKSQIFIFFFYHVLKLKVEKYAVNYVPSSGENMVIFGKYSFLWSTLKLSQLDS